MRWNRSNQKKYDIPALSRQISEGTSLFGLALFGIAIFGGVLFGLALFGLVYGAFRPLGSYLILDPKLYFRTQTRLLLGLWTRLGNRKNWTEEGSDLHLEESDPKRLEKSDLLWKDRTSGNIRVAWTVPTTTPTWTFVEGCERNCEQPEKYCNRKSEITTTTRGLSQSSLYDPLQDIKKRYSLGEHAKSLDKISSDLEQSLSNHHSYHTAKATPSRTSLHSSDEEYESLIQNSYTSLDEPVSGRPVPREARSWYTDPLHLSGICLKDSGGSRRILYPPDRATGTLGARLAAEKLAKSRVISRHEMELLSKQLSLRDTLALTYFPLTLGSKFSIEELDGTEDDALMLSPRPKISSKPDEAQNLIMGKPMTRPRSTGKFHRRHDDTDELYLLTQEAPQTASAAGINFTSPYIEDLAQLRMERLRIEEDRLLEKKRVAELERIRGPRTRWYESRGPDFHYEAHKNTEQIKNEKSWNDLLTYREDLAKSSLDCSKLYNKSLVF